MFFLLSGEGVTDMGAGQIQEEATPELLCEKVRDRFDIGKITMPSFKAFRDRLEEVI